MTWFVFILGLVLMFGAMGLGVVRDDRQTQEARCVTAALAILGSAMISLAGLTLIGRALL